MKRFMTDQYRIPHLRVLRRGDLFLSRLTGGRHHLYLVLADGHAFTSRVDQDRVLVLELDEHPPCHPLSGAVHTGPIRYYYALSTPRRSSARHYRIPREDQCDAADAVM